MHGHDAVLRRTVRFEETIRAAARRMAFGNHRSLLALEAGTPRRVVTDRDLVLAVLCGGLEPSARISAVPWRPLVTVARGERADEAFRLMELHGLRDLPVAEEPGGIIGMVAAEEALALLLRDLVELALRARSGPAPPLEKAVLRAEDARVELPTIDAGASPRAVAALLKRTGAEALGVCEGARPAGVVNERDLLPIVAGYQDAELCRARHLLRRPLSAVDPGAPFEAILERMASRGVDQVAVVRERRALGLVSLKGVLVRTAFEYVKLLAQAARPGRAGADRSRSRTPRYGDATGPRRSHWTSSSSA
jgi:CBS domain-containing protein